MDTVAVSRLFQFQLSETAEQEGDYGKWAQTWAALIGSGTAQDPGQLTIGLWMQAKSPIESFTLAASGAPNAPSLVAGPVALESLRNAKGALDGATRTLDALRDLRALMGSPAGSNNWVVDGQHTDIGQAFVVNDPHLSLQYPSNFHLSHLISSEDGLNVQGATFPGVPATLTGRGAHVGWGVTVVGYDVTDLYLETLVFQGQTPVGISFKGSTVPFIVVPQTYKFRTAAGLASLANPTPVLVAPPHGPVVSLDATSGTAVTARWTGQETQTDDVRAFLRLNNAASVDDAQLALEGDPAPDGGFYTGYWTGAQNFVLADDTGKIGYVPHACVPVRPWAASKAVYPYPVVPMDGRGNFEWATGPDGGMACVPNDKLPRAIGSAKGYLATANADPLGVSVDNDPYANNPGGVPYLSLEWDDQGYRIPAHPAGARREAGRRREGDPGRHAGTAGGPRVHRGPAVRGLRPGARPGRGDPRGHQLGVGGRHPPRLGRDGQALRLPHRSGDRCARHVGGGRRRRDQQRKLEGLPRVPRLPAAGARGDVRRRGGRRQGGPGSRQRGPRPADPPLRPGSQPQQRLLPRRGGERRTRQQQDLHRPRCWTRWASPMRS